MQKKIKHSKRNCKQEGLGINVEYTAPDMPQKCNFATLFNLVCAMINGGKFTTFLQSSLWAEAANTAMLLENHLIIPNKILSSFQQFFGKGKKSFLTLMQKIGEMCITTYKVNSYSCGR